MSEVFTKSIVFMGTPKVAALALEELALSFQVKAVVTQPDRPKGRGQVVRPPPIKDIAHSLGLEVLQPEKTRDRNFLERLRQIAPDLIVVVAYGGFLTKDILALPPLGCLNLHASLLPKYRGASPVQWAVLRGESETGWTTFFLDEGMDSGDVLFQRKVMMGPDEDAESLFRKMIPVGIALLKETVERVFDGRFTRTPQDEAQATLAPKLKKEDGKIDWGKSASVIVNQIRGLVPWPVAFTRLEWKGKSRELKIFKAFLEKGVSGNPGEVVKIGDSGLCVATLEDGLRLSEIQWEGSRRMSSEEFLRGHSIPEGTILGSND